MFRREVILTFKSYIPDDLKPGMFFITSVEFAGHTEPHIYQLEKKPMDDVKYMDEHGFPVQPYLIDFKTNIQMGDVVVVVKPEQIGWFADDDTVRREINARDMNKILNSFDGVCDIESTEDGEPILYMDQVTISYLQEEEDDDDDYDEEEDEEDDIDSDYNQIY